MTGETYGTLAVDLREGVLEIRMNRPEVLNALNRTMKQELLRAFQQARRDAEVRVVLLAAEGRGFCSGEDLKSHAGEQNRPLGESLRTLYNPLVLAMRELPKPIVAAVQGVAAGAGMSLALAADMRLLGRSAKLISVFARIGLVPDSGLSYILPRLVGLGRAMEIAMLAEPIDADQALALGLANRVFADSDLEAGAREFCQRLSDGPAYGLGLTKLALQRGAELSLREVLDYEAGLQELAGRSAEYREGTAAFLEKRPANYRYRGQSAKETEIR